MKTNPNFLTKLLLPVCLTVACALTTATAKAELFEAATAAEEDSVSKVDSDILKRRVVRVNFAELAHQTRVGAKLPINLFAGVSLQGTVKKVEDRGGKNYTLSGDLEGDEHSTFAVAVHGDAVAMEVRRVNGDLYQVRFVQNGLHEIIQVDESKFPECGVKAEHAPDPLQVAADAPAQPQGDTAEVIDVMVVYTAAARTTAGSSNAIHAQIDLAISGANTAFEESQVTTRFRLVYAGEVSYTESDMSTDLNRLTDPGDNHLDVVQSLRNTYGADLVSLWRSADGSACGLAWLMTTANSASFAANAFSVVPVGCAVGNLSFAHELAHNMGCHHDRANTGGGQGYNSYSYGWRFTANSVQYRTIMAYSPGNRIPRFSNPNVSYLGTPTGVAIGQTDESHNAQTINNTALIVANFRQTLFNPGISVQPQPQDILPGGTATFSVTAVGTAPFYYYWKRAGTNIAGATTSSSFSITNVQFSDENIYSVLVSNSVGTVLSSNASLTIDRFAEAVDNTGFSWTKFGNTPWDDQETITHDGVDAAESGVISHNGYSIFETPIVGPGTLSFWWKVSSEEGFDYLDVVFNGVVQTNYGISGDVDWTEMSFAIPAGNHTWGWQYSKDFSYEVGADKGWVDQIFYIGGSSFAKNSLGKTNGQYKFIWNGLAGATYSIHASTNLTSWAPLTNLIINNPSNHFIDAGSTGLNKRFYRITSP